MTTIHYLEPGQELPDSCDYWMLVERDENGLFYGSGYGRDVSGKAVFYVSLSESDLSLETALAAATEWAEQHSVDIVHVQLAQ